MVNSILIGQLIYQLLTQDSAVVALVSTKVFPIVAENDTSFPLITYQKTGINSNLLTKDGMTADEVTFQITVASDSYVESIQLANAVRKAIEHRSVEASYLIALNVKMTGITEVYNDATYVQTLTFNCTCIETN